MRHVHSRGRGAQHGRDRLAPHARTRTAAAARHVHNPHPCHRRARGSDVRRADRAVIALCAQESSAGVTRTRWMREARAGTRVSRRARASDTARMRLACREQRRAPLANTACPCRCACAQRRDEASRGSSAVAANRAAPSTGSTGCSPVLPVEGPGRVRCRTRRRREASRGVCHFSPGWAPPLRPDGYERPD